MARGLRRSLRTEPAVPGLAPGMQDAATAAARPPAPPGISLGERWRAFRERTRAPAIEKRVVFKSAWLPYALVAPQLAITLVFFIWPASQALWQSMFIQDAFGLSTRFVGLDNFTHLFADPGYLHSVQVTVSNTQHASVLVAAFGFEEGAGGSVLDGSGRGNGGTISGTNSRAPF